MKDERSMATGERVSIVQPAVNEIVCFFAALLTLRVRARLRGLLVRFSTGCLWPSN